MQRVSRACLRTFKISLNSPTVNQCCKHKPPIEYARSHINSSVNVKINFARKPRKFSKIPVRIFFAFNVASLMKFLGLMDENEDSELIQIIKKAEIAMIVRMLVFE